MKIVSQISNNAVVKSTESDRESATLGNIAKFASPHPFSPHETILMRFYLQTLSRELLPDERVAICLRKIIPGMNEVLIKHDSNRHAAHYSNLLVCSRLWTCPVCASKITESRATELSFAVARWHAGAGFVVMVTYTLEHKSFNRLHGILGTLREAHRKFKSGKGWQTLASKYTWSGSVSALEVTYGQNGWHPHIHELVFLQPLSNDNYESFVNALKSRWMACLSAFEWSASYEHGLDVKTGDSAVSDYISKYGKLPVKPSWTLEREITKSPVKRGHEGGRTPFQLLLDYGDGDLDAAALYREYAAEFKGRKQLVWSRGLRELLDLQEELPDSDLAESESDECSILATLTRAEWRQIINLPVDQRGYILRVASKGDSAALAEYLAKLGIVTN